jgi:SAM-dependent methyltransferase
VRWREAPPDVGLTWGLEISGEAFVQKAEQFDAFGEEKRILEIGPGYGRLLTEVLRRSLPFRQYVGVDLSHNNVEHLRSRFERDDVEFINEDIESVSVDEPFDTVLSSLTLKHIYPSFERALSNVAGQLSPGAMVIFDLIEGEWETFADYDAVTYVRWYTREQVEEILTRSSLELVAFDEVEHAPEYQRLLVAARKPLVGN